ncbi:MAG TPA: phage tail protein [Pyrinomonadaceae bacterium]|jgi:phage tail-like protein
MSKNKAYAPSGLLEYLPGIYREDEFVGQYLAAFERILLGREDVSLRAGDVAPAREPGERDEGLEETIAGLARYFDPDRTPAEFLEWLSGWSALVLRADLKPEDQRRFIAKAAWLYSLRGTKRGLAEVISIYTQSVPDIIEGGRPFQVGVHSTVGVDTLLDAAAPHFFSVVLHLATFVGEEIKQIIKVVQAVLDMEKPAHTAYALTYDTPSMQIADHSTVGVDTLLGA